MLNQCANPGCSTRFRRLQDGKLFLVEVKVAEASPSSRAVGEAKPCRRLEHYWLCDRCAAVLTLSFEHERGVVAVPLVQSLREKPVASAHSDDGISLTRIYDRREAAGGGINEA
jgi:hypothetical protein